MNTTKKIGALFAGCLGVVSAAPAIAAAAPAVPMLELRYDWADRETGDPQRVAQACPVAVLPPVDARQNKETVGAYIGGPLLSGDMGPWVNDGLGALKQYGLTVRNEPVGATPADAVAVRFTLVRAYTWHVGLKIFSMVAVKASFTDRNGAVQEKHYRAHGDKTNMWGAASEYVTTLNYGLNNMLPVIAKDVESLCQGGRIDPYTYAGPDPVVKKK